MDYDTAFFRYAKDPKQLSTCELKISNTVADYFIKGLKEVFELELLTAEIFEVNKHIIIKFDATEEKLKGLQHAIMNIIFLQPHQN